MLMNISKREWVFIGVGVILLVIALIGFFRPFTPEIADEVSLDWMQISKEEGSEEANKVESIFIVDVKGEVVSPGVYEVKEGERIIDVIQLAGGLTTNADETRVNLAALLEDEMVVYIPKLGEDAEGQMFSVTNIGGGQSKDDGKVAINRATSAELETLPGIGPAKAAAIISYREQHGPFKTVEDLLNISGIGPKSLEKIKDHVMIK